MPGNTEDRIPPGPSIEDLRIKQASNQIAFYKVLVDCFAYQDAFLMRHLRFVYILQASLFVAAYAFRGQSIAFFILIIAAVFTVSFLGNLRLAERHRDANLPLMDELSTSIVEATLSSTSLERLRSMQGYPKAVSADTKIWVAMKGFQTHLLEGMDGLRRTMANVVGEKSAARVEQAMRFLSSGGLILRLQIAAIIVCDIIGAFVLFGLPIPKQ